MTNSSEIKKKVLADSMDLGVAAIKATPKGVEYVDPVYWPAMARCPDCGRFMKRGLRFWIEHKCPYPKYAPKHSGFVILGMNEDALNEALLEYFKDDNCGVIISKARRCGLKELGDNLLEIKKIKENYIAGVDPYSPESISVPLITHPTKDMFIIPDGPHMTSKPKQSLNKKKKWLKRRK